jgi:hypothetical protein
MAKIFVVTSGDYSSYTVDRVFSTEEMAKEWIGISKGYMIEEYELDDMSNPNTLNSIRCIFNITERGLYLHSFEESTHPCSDELEVFIDVFKEHLTLYAYFPPDYEQDRCIKVISDAFAQLSVKFPHETWGRSMRFNRKTLERIR